MNNFKFLSFEQFAKNVNDYEITINNFFTRYIYHEIHRNSCGMSLATPAVPFPRP